MRFCWVETYTIYNGGFCWSRYACMRDNTIRSSQWWPHNEWKRQHNINTTWRQTTFACPARQYYQNEACFDTRCFIYVRNKHRDRISQIAKGVMGLREIVFLLKAKFQALAPDPTYLCCRYVDHSNGLRTTGRIQTANTLWFYLKKCSDTFKTSILVLVTLYL